MGGKWELVQVINGDGCTIDNCFAGWINGMA